jgi:hypothetical protein
MKISDKWMRSVRGSVALLAVCMMTATAALALEGTFQQPTYKRQARLDVCYFWGRECGRKPADTYCQVQGYERSVRFETEHVRPTRLASGGKICDAEFCVGFKSITCTTSASQRGKTTYWPQRID